MYFSIISAPVCHMAICEKWKAYLPQDNVIRLEKIIAKEYYAVDF